MKPRKLLTIIWLCISTSAVGAESLICSAEMSAGLVYDKSSLTWEAATMNSNTKYLVTKSDNPKARFEVRQFGSNNPVAYCKDDFSQEGHLTCEGFWQNFYFNRKALRFIHTYYAGYWNEKAAQNISPGRKEGDDTPGVIGGTCALL